MRDESSDRASFRDELEQLINRHGLEAASGTMDEILAAFLMDTLRAFDKAVNARDRWESVSR
jgi:hypothetical protein